jgi:hypothetical protein
MSSDWNIKPRSDECVSSGEGFNDGVLVFSRLLFTEDGYTREDYSESQWTDELRDSSVSVWKGMFRAPPPKAEEAIKKESAESLLRKLIETDDEENRNVIYILAVMLERKRILAERDVHKRDDGVTLRVYEHKKSSEVFLIPDPELKLAELEAVQEDVVMRLGWGASGSEGESEPEGGSGSAGEGGEAADEL